MRRLLSSLLLLAGLVYIIGHHPSQLERLLRTSTEAISRTEKRAANPDPARELDTFNGCGLEGDARSLSVRALDRLKNRYTAPSPVDINSTITLQTILAPGNDISRWRVKEGAELVGYVWDVKQGGIESTNCHARDDPDRDTHIELVLDPMHGAGSQRMIIEVTPRWRHIMRERGADWSTRALRDRFMGRWVKVRGWMLFDADHRGESENMAPGRPGNWRATAWEIHPVTSIEVVLRPR
jgi:hypothetical protein